ncbi:MAG TPA: DUF6319 family protein [Actinopolymorphaceae bacterium]|jgi:hypothetical protein
MADETKPKADQASQQDDTSRGQEAPAANGEATPDAQPRDDVTDGGATRQKRGRPRKAGAGKAPGVELVLTVTGTADALNWQAEVTHGSKRVVKALPVPASAVAAAAKDLHPDVAEAIDAVLEAARDLQRSRVEQLQAELEAAQRALADLETN